MKKIDKYESLLVISTGFVLIYIISASKPILYVAFGLAVLGIFSPFLADKIAWAWNKLAEGLGYVSSRIILSIIFYVFLLPISILYRIAKKDLLNLKRSKKESIFVERNKVFTKEDLETIW